MIQAGFSPASSAYLNDAIRHIVKTEINLVIHKFKISLPESTGSEALVIPGMFNNMSSKPVQVIYNFQDPLGVLEENEIYYRSSNPMKNITTQTLFQTLVGRVIVSLEKNRRICILSICVRPARKVKLSIYFESHCAEYSQIPNSLTMRYANGAWL
jgi:hypothetical protein